MSVPAYRRRRKFLMRQAVRQKMKCCYCLTRMIFWKAKQRHKMPKNNATNDHIIPKARGGRNFQSNFLVCCQACNLERSDLPADLFALFKVWQRNGKPEL